MAGHNKWSSIKNKKGKEDKKRGKIFTKLARAIIVAVREGGDEPDYNPALKTAIEKAKSENMPNDNIERAIKKGAGISDGEDYSQSVYEGYGPEGIAIIIECLTDNKNRTASNIRHYLDKFGGNLGQTGSVLFLFDQKGIFLIQNTDQINEDEFFMDAVELGVDEIEIEDDGIFVNCEKDHFMQVKNGLEQKGYQVLKYDIAYLPKTESEITDPKNKHNMDELIAILEEDDDVQNIYTNWADTDGI